MHAYTIYKNRYTIFYKLIHFLMFLFHFCIVLYILTNFVQMHIILYLYLGLPEGSWVYLTEEALQSALHLALGTNLSMFTQVFLYMLCTLLYIFCTFLYNCLHWLHLIYTFLYKFTFVYTSLSIVCACLYNL